MLNRLSLLLLTATCSFLPLAQAMLTTCAGELSKDNSVTTSVDPNLPPKSLSLASDFETEVFTQVGELSEKAQMQLIAFVDNDPDLEPMNLTRRVFNFMGTHTHLTQIEKFNFFTNLVRTYRDFQMKEGVHSEDAFFAKNLAIASDGSRVICGSDCVFYFVITPDGSFYSASSNRPVVEDSTAYVSNDWRAAAKYLKKAGEN